MSNAMSEEIIRLVARFNDALNHHDIDTMMQYLTDDCVFENTSPFPDGTRYEGQRAVRAFWEEFFRGAQKQAIEIEEIFACGNRGVMRWVYRWQGADAQSGHIRGVDIYSVRDGRIVEKMSYVKG